MKKTIILSLAVIAFIFNGCRKDTRPIAQQQGSPTLALSQVRSWYDSISARRTQSLQTFDIKKLAMNWGKAESFDTEKSNYWLITLPGQPSYQGIRQGYRKIAFLKDSTGSITARILEIIPDIQYAQRSKNVQTKDFTGRVFIYDDQYRLLGGKIYSGGKQAGRIRPGKTDHLRIQQAYVTESCDWYDSSYIDAEGVFTIHSEQVCNYEIYDNGFDLNTGNPAYGGTAGDPLGSGGGAPTVSLPQTAELPAASNPAVNPKSYMICFGNIPDAGASMQITVYVQEPQPGTSFPFGVNGVGHTAIGLSKTGGGQTINQVVGFYPNSTNDLLGGTSKIVDNHDMNFNASITYTVTAEQFNKVVNYIINPPAIYDIYNFNCTNFAINACAQGGITLPNANTLVGLNGVGGLAYSMTPGGLGNSLDSMKGQNNVNNNGGAMPKSHGPCN